MIKSNNKIDRRNSPCPGCGGSGQSSFFAGASRFILTYEDCPDCCGTGVILDQVEPDPEDPPEQKS